MKFWNRKRKRKRRELRHNFEVLESRLLLSTLLPLPGRHDLVYDPLRELLYITSFNSTVERYDPKTNTLLEPFIVGGSPENADITPDGAFLYVTDEEPGSAQGFVHKVNLDDGVVTTISFESTSDETGTWDISIGDHGKALLSAHNDSSHSVPFREIDLSTDDVSARNDIATLADSASIYRSADHSVSFVFDGAKMYTYEAAMDRFSYIAGFATPTFSTKGAVNRDGSLIAIERGDDIAIMRPDFSAVESFDDVIGGMAFDPSRDVFYVADDDKNEIVVYDTMSWKELARFQVGEQVRPSAGGVGAMTVSADGKYLFFGTFRGVRVFDLESVFNPPNKAPVTVRDAYYSNGGPLIVSAANGVLTNDRDPDGDVLQAFQVGSPSHGTLELQPDGSFTYTPDVAFQGTDYFGYRAYDGNIFAPVTLVSVTVRPDVRSFQLPVKDPMDLVYDQSRGILYMTTLHGKIERYDVARERLLPPFQLGNLLLGADITEDGQFLYVAEGTTNVYQGFLRKVDLDDGSVTNLTYDRDGAEGGTWDVAVGSNGKGFVSTQFSGSGTVPFRELNLADDTLNVRSFPGAAHRIGKVSKNMHIHRSADRSLFLTMQSNSPSGLITTYDPALDLFPAMSETPVSRVGSRAALNPSGSLIAVNVFDAISIFSRNLEPLASITELDDGMVFDPGSDTLYALDVSSDEIVAIDSKTWKESLRFNIGEDIGPSHALGSGVMTTSNEGRFLFLIASDGVRVYDLDSTSNNPPNLDALGDVEVAEGSQIVVPVSGRDPDQTDSLTFSLDSAPSGAAINPITGRFTWTADEGLRTAEVTVRVTDDGFGKLSDTETFEIIISNRAPTATLDGPASGVPGQPLAFNLGASDPSPLDQAAGFTYAVDWGDGSPVQIANGPDGQRLGHVFTHTGQYSVHVTATDKDGAASATVSQTLVVSPFDLQVIPQNLSRATLFVGGTPSDDAIELDPWRGGVRVHINGALLGTFFPSDGVMVYGQAGNDDLVVHEDVAIPVTLFGDAGDDRLRGARGNDALHGGPGNDLLDARQGDDLLFGDDGDDELIGGPGDDILFGGPGNDLLDGQNGDDSGIGGLGTDVWLDAADLNTWTEGLGWKPLAGAWDGKNRSAIGLFDPETSTFYLKHETTAGPADLVYRFGPAGYGWIPLAGDWDGDGITTVGLYDPNAATFYFRNEHAPGPADATLAYEQFALGQAEPDWLPVAGDWDRDGIDTVGLYDPGEGEFHLNLGSGSCRVTGPVSCIPNANADLAETVFRFGPRNVDWLPVAGDWDDNGRSSVGLFDPATSTFFLKNGHTPGPADVKYRFGPSGQDWIPVPGQWRLGDESTAGLYDPMTGQMFLRYEHAAGIADVTFRYGPVDGPSTVPLVAEGILAAIAVERTPVDDRESPPSDANGHPELKNRGAASNAAASSILRSSTQTTGSMLHPLAPEDEVVFDLHASALVELANDLLLNADAAVDDFTSIPWHDPAPFTESKP